MNNKKQEIQKAFLSAFPHTIPVLTGFAVLGIAYGILMRLKGYGIVLPVLFSAVAFCGSMQFIAITLLTTAFDPVQAFFLSLTVNARHLFYGISMLEKYRSQGKQKYFLIYTLCDETFSISCSVDPPGSVNRKYFYFFISLLNYLYWIAGTFIGALVGNIIPFNTKGLDFVLTALFVVLFLEQLKKKEKIIPALIGITCTVASLLIFGRENPVIPAMIMILFALTAGRKKICG